MTNNDPSAEPQRVTSPESTAAATGPDQPQAVTPPKTDEGANALDERERISPPSGLSSTMPLESARAAQILQRRILPFLLPPLLLVVITAVVVALGSGLLLLGTSELQVGPVVVAKAVVAAGLGVLVIGSGALWLAARA